MLSCQAILWLVAAIGLAVFAVGWGSRQAVRHRHHSRCPQGIGHSDVPRSACRCPYPGVPAFLYCSCRARGLAILVVAFVAEAVVSGVVLWPNATLTDLRVGVSIAITIELVAMVVLGIAAWMRIRELVVALAP